MLACLWDSVFYKQPFSFYFSIISKFSAISLCKFYKTKTIFVFKNSNLINTMSKKYVLNLNADAISET